MINRVTDKCKYGYWAGISLILLLSGVSVSQLKAGDRSAVRKEQVADRRFIRQKFAKAMLHYEKAVEEASSSSLQATLHAKTARLYYMLRRYPEAGNHFSKAILLQKESLSTEDVCCYIDVLRSQGLARRAEEVCLSYAYQDAYGSDQRYINLLDALSMRHVSNSGEEYEVFPELSCNTAGDEYWIGRIGGKPYFARSNSPLHDRSKRFYYNSEFYAVPNNFKKGFVAVEKEINGPFTQFYTGKKQIYTILETKTGRKDQYITRLMISGDGRKERERELATLFPQQEGYSYCHPFLLEGDRILLFASDAPGGYGGYDLYLSRWDEQMERWRDPENLGSEINTIGNEIFPTYENGCIYFASDGQIGYGGYDLYEYAFDTEYETPVSGSLVHLPAPINSAFNDFSLLPMDETWGYFVSDRKLELGDDIYVYRQKEAETGTKTSFYGMSEYDALTGGRLLFTGGLKQAERHRMTKEEFPAELPREAVFTVYFDFNRSDLTPESTGQLNRFLQTIQKYKIRRLKIEGYADDMGSDEYNLALSRNRGEAVATYLRRYLDVPADVKGCGSDQGAKTDREFIPAMENYELFLNPELVSGIRSRKNGSGRKVYNRLSRVDVYIDEK